MEVWADTDSTPVMLMTADPKMVGGCYRALQAGNIRLDILPFTKWLVDSTAILDVGLVTITGSAPAAPAAPRHSWH